MPRTRNTKTRSVERPETDSRKFDKELKELLTAKSKLTQAIWEEECACRRKLSALNPNKNPNAAKIAQIKMESLKKRTDIMSDLGKQQVMSWPGGLNMKSPFLSFEHPFADRLACSEQVFHPPYPVNSNFTRDLPYSYAPDPGFDGETLADRKTGHLIAKNHVFHSSASFYADAGFWIPFHLQVNPVMASLYGERGYTQIVRMRIIASFSPLQSGYIVDRHGLEASSVGSVRIIVSGDQHFAVDEETRLFKSPRIDEWESQYSASRVFISPWFKGASWTQHNSVYVGVTVHTQADYDAESQEFGIGYGSINGVLSSVTIQQCPL